MKKSMSVILIGVLMISLAACGAKSGHDAYKEIYKRYNELESFYAEAEITVRNVRTENTYYVRQFYKEPDMYSLVVDAPEEVAGSGYVFKGGEVLIKSGFGHSESLGIYSPNERNAVFLIDFFEEYYKSEDTDVKTSGKPIESTTVLNCFISGKKVNRFSQSLWVDNKTFLPVKLETYDVDGKPVVTVKYNEFKRNCKIEDSNFQ